MPNLTELEDYTKLFFLMYWNPQLGLSPCWSEPWDWKSEIPGQSKRGCYALFHNDDVIYIGVGIGKSTEKYDGAGLGDRLKRYWQLNKGEDKVERRYQPTSDWHKITTIRTISFDKEHYHLAAALEIFLIRKLKPTKNNVHKGNRT